MSEERIDELEKKLDRSINTNILNVTERIEKLENLMEFRKKEPIADFNLFQHIADFNLFQTEIDELKERVENYLLNLATDLEPNTHCCECTPGKHFERHGVHIQYPGCSCKPENYVLRRNENE